MSDYPGYTKDTLIESEDDEYYNEEEIFYKTEREIVRDIYEDIKKEYKGSILPLFDLLTEEDLMSFLNFEE